MIKVDTRVIGTAEIRDRFLRTGDAIRDRIRRALVAAGQDVQAAAQAGAPRQTGRLADSIKVKLVENDGQMKVQVGPPVFYGRFIEFGVGPTTVQVDGRRVRSRDVRGIVGVRTKTTKTGTVLVVPRRGIITKGAGAGYSRRVYLKPRPFMAPAIDRVRAQIDASLDAALEQALSENS